MVRIRCFKKVCAAALSGALMIGWMAGDSWFTAAAAQDAGLQRLAALAGNGDVSGNGNVSRWETLDRYCIECHNFTDWAGGIAFDVLDPDDFSQDVDVWEKTVRKVRTGMMPPADQPRPERAALDGLASWVEARLDEAWAASPNPGAEARSRLNRTEYGNAIRDLLSFDAALVVDTLPADESLAGFDNIAEALTTSPALMEGYLSAAMFISRHAVGEPSTAPTQVPYNNPADAAAQRSHIDGLPLGTRGGMEVTHHFPLDAQYVLRIAANIPVAGRGNDQGRLIWCDGPAIHLTVNGVTVPVGEARTARVRIPAGPQRITAALLDDVPCSGYGELHLGDVGGSQGAIQGVEIDGPYDPTGVGDTPSRRTIFSCHPQHGADENGCAIEILTRLATRAYRQPVEAQGQEIATLMEMFELGRDFRGTFDSGIQYALTRMLVDPRFLFRFEAEREDVAPGEVYRITDHELAARLSFFLWSSIPDDELLALAHEGRLSHPDELAGQVRRMLADPRAEALVHNFAGQWLKLRELQTASRQDPAFNVELRRAMRLETELFFASILREDRSVLELLDADYTYLNERLAAHYGIEGVRGSYMRRVSLPDTSPRRGLLGHGSILTATSVPNRTSPVVRGEWVLQNLLGAPIPPPPPGVEADLSEEGASRNGVLAETLRERLEQHLSDPGCASCHQAIDPIGFALENFDLVGRWREQDNGHPIDTVSQLVDGTVIDGPFTLRRALLDRSDSFTTALAERLLTYALGRPLVPEDMPVVRAIVRNAEAKGHTFSALVEGIVASPAFQYRIGLD